MKRTADGLDVAVPIDVAHGSEAALPCARFALSGDAG
jgi:hypothetical protein